MAYGNRHFRASYRGGRVGQPFLRPEVAILPKPGTSQKQFEIINTAQSLAGSYSDNTEIRNVEYVASFNWQETRDPVILVPGRPARWQPPQVARSLRKDDGKYYRDPNSARFPSHPIQPAIRAIDETVSGFDPSEVDIFGCGNTIGSLLSFAQGEERTFRFGVEYIGTGLFLVRKTNKPAELIEDVRGYGHTFPEEYTQWDKSVKNSASHQRIIKYDFAGLKCFVRSESDGYLPDLLDRSQSLSDKSNDGPEAPSFDINQPMALALGLQQPSKSNKLTVRHAGGVVPQRALFDLKTRALKSKGDGISVDNFLHRLWVSQIPNMILAYHTYGKFEAKNIHVVDVRDKVAEWEIENAPILSRLAGLLHKLIDVAKVDGKSCFEVRRSGNGPLELWSEVPKWSALPPDLKQRWGVSDSPDDGRAATAASQQEDEDEDEDDEDVAYLRF